MQTLHNKAKRLREALILATTVSSHAPLRTVARRLVRPQREPLVTARAQLVPVLTTCLARRSHAVRARTNIFNAIFAGGVELPTGAAGGGAWCRGHVIRVLGRYITLTL